MLHSKFRRSEMTEKQELGKRVPQARSAKGQNTSTERSYQACSTVKWWDLDTVEQISLEQLP